MNILIVDDDDVSGMLMERMLQTLHYVSIRVTSGPEALSTLKSRTDIRLLIVDILMPGMDGLELLRTIKGSSLFKDLPVIMYSSLADIDHVRAAASLGCSAYLVKPIEPEILKQKVLQTLNRIKPTLGLDTDIMLRRGLDKKNYDEVSRAFLTLLESEIDLIKDQLNPTTAIAPLHLKRVAEGASVLGAVQLESRILDLLQSGGNRSEMKLNMLRLSREMQHVTGLIKARESTVPHSAVCQ